MAASVGNTAPSRERVLIDQEVMWVRGGVLFVKGRLVLTPELFRFLPDGFLDKLAGAEPFEHSLDDVENLEVDSKNLLIRCAGQELRFRGDSISVLGERLGSALIERREGSDRRLPGSAAPAGQQPSAAPKKAHRPPTHPGGPARGQRRPTQGKRPQTGSHPTRRPPTGSHPTRRPPTGSQPAHRPSTGSNPTRRPQTGSHPTQRPTTGSHPTQRPTTGSHKALGNRKQAFLKGERVLVSGVIEAHVSALLSAKGNIVLTDRRLRFTIEGKLDRLVGKDAEFDYVVKELQDVEFNSLRKILKVVSPTGTVTLQGALTARLYSQFMALGIGRQADDAETASQLMETWEVQHFRGPLAHPGHLVIGHSHMTFAPSGALDSMVGAKVIELNINRITRVAVHGARDRRIHIFEGDTDFAFAVDRIGSRISTLASILLHTPPPGAPEHHPERGWIGENAEELLASIDKDYLLEDDEDPLALAMGLHWVGVGSFRRVWCVLTKNRVLLLPIAGKDRSVEALIDGLRRGKDDDNPSDLGFYSRGSYVRFTPRSGQPFVTEFWDQVEAVLQEDVVVAQAPAKSFRPRKPSAKRRSADLPANLGRLNRVSFTRGDWNVATFHDAPTTEYPRGIGIIYKGIPSQDLYEGVELDVELARDDGLYRFTSTLIEVRDVKDQDRGGIGLAKASARFLLGLDNPDHVEFINRREGVRVRYGRRGTLRRAFEDAEGNLNAEESGFAVDIEQISIVGGAVLTDRPLEQGSVLSIEIPVRIGNVKLFGRVVRIDPPSIEEQRQLPRYSLSFLALKTDDVDKISSAVMQRQRESRPLFR